MLKFRPTDWIWMASGYHKYKQTKPKNASQEAPNAW